MIYSNIRVLQSKNKLSNDDMGKIIGLTGVGYAKMVNNRTCTVAYLEKIAEFFSMPISYFYSLVSIIKHHILLIKKIMV